MATYRRLAGGCDNGPCPNFSVDDSTGNVLVQGYVTTDTPPDAVPDGEAVVLIPAAWWRKILAQLPR